MIDATYSDPNRSPAADAKPAPAAADSKTGPAASVAAAAAPVVAAAAPVAAPPAPPASSAPAALDNKAKWRRSTDPKRKGKTKYEYHAANPVIALSRRRCWSRRRR